ncbi:MAG TPA: type I secretion C-terminal target domain-containing protein, partial [Alphaproteobacteria bacterium]|nr:type I secretion C-terminal target domain-containing protein [Alphaproteobacteria bacterium]
SNTTANSNVEEFDVIVDAVADKPLINANDVHLSNGATSVAVDIDISLSDKDGSESFTHVQISGVPTGFTFNKGVNLGNGIWQFEPADLTGLKINTSNPNFNGTLNLVATAFNKEKISDKDFDLTNNTNKNSDGFKVTFNAPPVAKDNTYKLFELPANTNKGVVGDTFITSNNGKTKYQMTGGATVYKDTGTDKGGFWYKLPILDNDSDPNGDPLIITKIYNIQGMSSKYEVSIDPSGKFLIVKIQQDGNAKDSTFTLEYQITDGNGGYDTAKVTVSIADHNSPLVFDLDGDGVELLSNENGVLFDIDNDGTLDQVGWAGKDDGLLAIDINGDGVINNQSELFGNNAQHADGFANLAQYDDNGDGKIDALDAAFQNLLIWQDANSDGFSQAGEMFSLVYLNIASISLSAQEVSQTLEGNQISHIGSFTFNDGSTGEVVDAWFETTSPETNTTFTAQDGISDLFVFVAGGDPSQVVERFNSDEGDVLDISALLNDDFDPLQDAINEFVFATANDDGSTTLSVDADGAAGPGAAIQFVTLQGVTTTVDELVNNGSIAT